MLRRPSPEQKLPSPLGRAGRVAGLMLAGAGLVLAGAAALQGPKKAGPPAAARYLRNEGFQVVLEGDANAFNDLARVTKIEFYPLDGSAMKPDYFEAVGTPRVLLKGRPNPKAARGSRLAVVLRKKPAPAPAAAPAPGAEPAQVQPVTTEEYAAVAGEVVVYVDPDGASGPAAAEPTDPVDVEPMPDPCGPGTSPLAPERALTPAPTKP